MTLTKSHIADAIQQNLNLSRKSSVTHVETLLEIMKRTLEQGEDLLISGFGKFSVKDKRERKGRNPATGEPILLDKRRVITFSCSQVLREKINT